MRVEVPINRGGTILLHHLEATFPDVAWVPVRCSRKGEDALLTAAIKQSLAELSNEDRPLTQRRAAIVLSRLL